jgi:proton glutamate symport protein
MMSRATRILVALIVGLSAGILAIASGGAWVEESIAIVEPIGTLWLNALRMTIVPLVVALLITGIATSAEAARANRLAGRALLFFVLLLWLSALAAAILTPLFLDLFPLPAEAAQSLREALTTSEAA